MELIADGGSTKVDWVVLDDNKLEKFRVRSIGLNPAVVFKEELVSRLLDIEELVSIKNTVKSVSFYGAGCGSVKPKDLLTEIFQSYFVNAKVLVAEDMLAAIYAASFNKESIVCILGTGSNSCYYNGYSIEDSIPSLGYTVMDEASGNYFGKILLSDYFYKVMPEELRLDFEKQFNLDVDAVKKSLYKKENPNMYLASFSKFMFDYKDEKYIKNTIKRGFNSFFKKRVLCYNNRRKVPLYFIGSIAFYFKDILEKCARKNKLEITNIIQRPIEGLIKYHQQIN